METDNSDEPHWKRKKTEKQSSPLVPNSEETLYEVFLSFCGDDTRKGFTDFLYTFLVGCQISTFRDNDELPVGESIGPELLKAINESKISIPIFSTNYASSRWCMRELSQMVHCHNTKGQMILPIFYDVEPSHVRNQTGSYEEAFRQHGVRFDETTVQGWKEALAKVGDMKGLELNKETNGHQGKLVRMVVEKVKLELKKDYMYVPDNLVGMTHHLKTMKELLNVDSNCVRIVGIHGMGGIGKTTIAKVIYNELCEHFKCCCFVEDVRVTSQHTGLVNLKNQLRRKKALIVLDDVDQKSQLDKLVGKCDWFHSGSRIIVTSRNKEVLDHLKVTFLKRGLPEVYRCYEPSLMHPHHSLQLFSKYAFERGLLPEDYGMMSKEVVNIAAGLPLVLVNIGSLLYGKCITFWEEKLKMLKKTPHEEVMKKLRISFEALEAEQKEIFLDIACFFIGENKINPLYMWGDCEYYPISGINALVLRSLVKVRDDNTLWMHDQLRDLGRHIVREEKLNELGARSRLWHPDEALNILERRMGTKKVVALCLDLTRERQKSLSSCLVGEQFEQMSNLRFLRVGQTDIAGDFNNVLSNLRWLDWRVFSSRSKPTNFHLMNLVILDLSYSKITEKWEGWCHVKMATKLKVLDLSHCDGLRRAPEFSTFASLERLILKGCGNLVEIDPPSGKLIKLRVLDVKLCWNLTRVNCSTFATLESLDVSMCTNLHRLDGLEELVSLRYLSTSDCTSLERLPNLSDCQKFKTVDTSLYRNMETQGLDRLGSLEHLGIIGCYPVERLPDLSYFRKLKELILSRCEKLREIEGLSFLDSLESLDVMGCISLESIPDLSNLKRLKKLKTRDCNILIQIQGLDKLESLELLDIRGCNSIRRLPDLSRLGRLRVLDLCGCRNLRDVEGLMVLKSLKFLDLSWCISLEKIPDLSNLKNLEELKLNGFVDLTEIPGLEALKSLELLEINDCKSIKKLPDLSNHKNLKQIKACGCVELTEILGIEELKSTCDLDICGSGLIENLQSLSNIGVCMENFIDVMEESRSLQIKSLEYGRRGTSMSSMSKAKTNICFSYYPKVEHGSL